MKKYAQNGSLWLLLTLGVIVILFISSSQTFEEQSQSGTLHHLLKGQPFANQLSQIDFTYGDLKVNIKSLGYYGLVEFLLRKLAHFVSFFSLAAFLFLALKNIFRRKLWLLSLLAWFAPTGYAGMDEFHQMITGGRTPQIQDVMLDSFGALVAVLLLLIIHGIQHLKIR